MKETRYTGSLTIEITDTAGGAYDVTLYDARKREIVAYLEGVRLAPARRARLVADACFALLLDEVAQVAIGFAVLHDERVLNSVHMCGLGDTARIWRDGGDCRRAWRQLYRENA